MPRETSRHSRDDHDRRKADHERDRDHDRRRERDSRLSDRRRESDSDNRTRATATAADFTSMPNPTSFTSMPFAAMAAPTQFSSPPRQYAGPPAAADNSGSSQRRRAPSSSSSGSSTASSLLDISRHYPQNRYGGFFGTFFKAPSERRRRRRSAARSSKRRTFYFGGGGSGTGNTSSSSVNSDLAYGHGYIPKLQRRRSSGGSNSFRQGVAGSGRVRDVVDNAPRRPDGPMRGKTDEEILEIGRQLSDLARKQNKHDLKAAGYVKPTLLAAAAAGVGKYRKSRKEAEARGARGIGSSKIHGASSEESDWEDTSDEEEESDGADSILAYGSVVSSVVRPNLAGRSTSHAAGPYAAGAGATTAAAAAAALADPERRGSVVDPRLFGPVNSLRGMITTPCGFGQEPHPAVASPSKYQTPSTYQTTADARRYPAPPTESSVDGRRPMREVYPIPTSDPGVFDADLAASQELPRRARTSTVPLEQPIPKLPVSSKVYDAEKFEDTGRRQRDAPPQHDSTAAGFAAAAALGAVGAAALASDQKEDKKEKKSAREYERERDRDRAREKDRDRERERERERERDKYRRDRDRDSKRRDKDSEKEKDSRKSKRDSYSSSKHDKDHKRDSRYDDEESPRKRRETEADYYADSPSSSRRDRSKRGGDDTREELSRSSQRDSKSHPSRDDRKEDKGKSVDRYDFSYGQGAPISKVDPFLYQVADGAFSTADLAAPTGPPGRPLTPNIVTIDREPNFDDYEPYKPYEPYVPLVAPEARLSRRDSFEMEERVHAPQDQAKRYDHGSHVYEEGEHEARSIYDQAKHATIPVAAAAVASAIAVEAERSRERRRDRYDEEGSRDRESWKRDTVQEEADRYYRESVIARKIEEEQMRSETPENNDARQVRIVTPPEMHEQHKTTGPYDAPNADVRIDNQLFPTETSKFEKKNGKRKSNFKSRDPSCERDRPVLNLVFPTPLPSREPTPKVEKQVQRNQQPEPQAKSDSSPEVVIGPRGDIVKVEPSNKSVSWGENSTKSFEVESADGRSDAEKEKAVEPTEKPRARLSRASPWGIIAAAVAGSSSEPSGEPDTVTKRGSGKDDYGPKAADARDISAGPEQVYTVEARDQPPVPGPKPTSPTRDTLPGSFADDIEFAATLAAGLKDTGFDSNIVVDDPTYRRRDSPPGTREANGDEWNQRSMSDIVMDIASKKDPNRSVVSEPAGIVRDQPANGNSSGNVGDEWEAPKKLSKKDKKKLKNQSLDLGESSTPTESSTAPESTETPTFEDAVEDLSKLSKKEQKRREKQAKALALLEGDGRSPQPEPEVVERSLLTEGAAADTWEEPSSKKEKKKKSRKSQDAAPEDLVTVPSNAFDDFTSLRKSDKDETASIGVDDWDNPSKSKRKSKSERDDERPRSVVAESELSTSSKKSSSKSKRRSIVEADDGYGSDAAKKSSTSRHRDGDDGYASDTTKKSSRSKHRAGGDGYGSDTTKKSSKSKHCDGDDGYGSDFSRRSSKSKRRSGTEGDFDYGSDTPSRRRSMFDDRDVSSVVSEARGDGRRREREKDRDRDRDRDRDGRSSSKRSSRRYDDDDDDARSVVSVASSPGGTRKSKESKRSSGLFASIFKRDDDKKEKESSFLDNAGTLGAGVGLAGAAAIVAAGASRSHATDRSSSEATPDDNAQSASRVESHNYDTFDPEIAPRAIKPAIDPQYGDLLPLPPSEPGSPRPEPGELPALPDSRPNTPPDGHDTRRDQLTHRRRRSTQETPSKSPSNTAIPISLRLGQRAPLSPSSIFKSPPVTTAQSGTATDSASKRASRGTSWDSSREIKPLYLLEHSRHGSVEATLAKQEDLPALPPSQSASEISFTEDSGSSRAELASSGLHIDTRDLPLEQHGGGSQETTPRAEVKPTLPFNEDPDAAAVADPDAVDSMSKDRSSYLLDSTPSSTKTSSAPPDGEAALPLPDVAEDLTSADERFEDALDVQSRRWSEDSAAVMQDASEHPQDQQSEEQAEPLTRELVAPAPLPPIEAPEPNEWAGLSAKQRKKLRKAMKNQSLELGEPAPAESPPEPASESEPKSEPALERELAPVEELAPELALELASKPVPEIAPEPAPFAEVPVPEPQPAPQPALETVPEPALESSAESVPVVEEPVTSVANASNIREDLERTPTQDVFQEPKKGKKGKKNKKKSHSWEDDAMEAATIVAGTAVLAGAAALVNEVTANKESAAASKSEIGLHSSSDAAHSSPAEAQDVPAEVRDLALEIEPHPAEQKLEQVKSLVGEDAATGVTPTHAETSLDAKAAGVQDTGADGEDEWSTTSTSKNDKKKKNKKKKKSLVVDDIPADLEPLKEAVEETPVMAEKHEEAPPAEPESTAEATQDRVAAAETQVQVAADTPVEEIISAKDAVSAVPQPESITNTPADADEGSTPSSSDKDKKKKKNKNKNKKSLSPDEAPLELQPESAAVHETLIASEQAFKDLAAEEAPTTAPEQTEIEVAAESQTGSTDNTLEADDFSPTPATSKKDKKKKKKRNSVVFEDHMPADDSLPTEDPVPATDGQTPTPLELEQPEPVSNEETVVEEAPEEPAPSEQQQELKSVAKPEDEFAVVTKDKKKKKKDKRKSVQFEATPDVFSPPPQEEETAPGTDLPETRDIQDDPAAATLQPQDTILSTQESVFDETEQQLGSASTTQTDSQPLTDDWNALVPKKKGKKNKKNQKDGSATEDSATTDKDAAEFARQMEFGDVVPATTATEFDNKVDLTDEISAEANRSLEFSDATAAAEETKDKAVVESEDEWSRLISGNKPAELREDAIIASHHTEAPDMIVNSCEKRDEALEPEAKAESPAETEPSVEDWPVATGKKGKKGKKKKKSASSTPPEVPPPQLDTVVTTETETSAEAAPEPEPEPESVPQSADAAEAEPLRHATEAEPVELAAKELATQAPSEPTADEAASFPPAKLSKKDKKNMKKLSVFQDVDDDAPKEVHEAETATTVEKTSEQPLEKSLDDGAEIAREVIVEPVTSVAETPELTPEPESAPVQQEEANPADEWGGLARKPSKKDKKKKKKQASVDEPKLEATESVLPTESMESTAPVKETEPENVIAAALETEPEPQLAELEQSTPDESLDGVSAKASKKDKKKKKMKQAAFEIAEAEAIKSKTPIPEPQPELKEVDSGSLELQSGVEQPEGEHQPIKAPMLEADAAPVQDDAVQAEPQPVSKEASPENLALPAAATAAEPEDDSGGLSRKLSKKKEKKAKKKAQGEATAHTLDVTPAEDTMVEKTNEQLVEATTTNLPKELDESKEPFPDTLALESMTEADSGSFATKLSTKDKKIKKNQSINEVVQALDGAPAEELAEPPIEQSMDPTIAQDADGESRGLAEPLTESTRQETVLEDEQAVNAESSKMETEAKELTGGTSVLPEETQGTPRNPSDEKPSEPVTGAVAGMLSSEPAPEPPAEAVVPDAVSETPAKEAETENDWGSFASGSSKKDKKKNKKKKAKNESPLPWEEPTTPPSEETSTPPVAESQETVNPPSKEERPEPHVELASELVEPAAEPVVTPASEPVVEPTPEPAIKLAPKIVVEPAPEALTGEVEAADEGSSLPSKSSKRDKKKKRKSVAEVMEPTLQEPTETTEEQPLELAAEVIPEGQNKDEAPEVPTEPVVKEAEPEDESMAGLSKKEKKKLKRAGLAAAALGAAAGAVGASALIGGTPEAAQEPEQMQDVKEDAKQAEIETAPVSAAAESEATQAATKPMSKKDKKKAKKLDLLLADITEPTPITEEVAAPKMTAEEAAVETPPLEPPTSSWADEMTDTFPLGTKAEATEEDTKAADESGFEAPISRKKSKKDKKRKSVLDSVNSPPSEPTVEADAAVAVEEPAAAEPAATEPVLETSAPAETQAPALEEDAWALPTKKGKKGKKGQQAATLNAEPEPVPAEQPAAIMPEASQPAATRETSAVEPTQTVAAAAESAVPAEDDAEDMWAMPSKKKKSKKSKSTSPADHQVVEEKIVPEPVPVSVPEPIPEPTPEPIPELAAESAAELAAEFEVAPEPALLPTESKAAVDSEPTVPTAEADDEVPQPMKKKGKKSKKLKSISLAEVEETENKAVSEPVADSNQSVAQTEPKLAADNDSSTTTKKGKGNKAKKMSFSALEDSVGEPSNSEAPMEVENDSSAVPVTENTTAFVEEPGAMSDTEVRGDDNWAVPVKKKSKKDKKRQSAQQAIPDTKATAKLEKDLWNDDDFFTAEKSRRDDAITTGDEKQERRYDEAVSVGDVERDDLPDVEMTTSVDDKFSSSDSRMTTTERSKSTGSGKGKASRDSLEAVGAAAAITGGVAALAQMYGGGKKKKGKKSKIVDKRQPQEDDMFDDPALWEGAVRKNVVEESRDEVADDGLDEFWGPSRPDPGPSMAPQTPAGTSFTESGDEWKETARQGVPVNDEFVESPILGLDETSLPQSTAAGLLRRDSRLEEPVGGLFQEAPRDVSSRQLFTEPSELRSSPTRALPAVQELPEAEKAAATGEVWPAIRPNRDSGFIPESPPRRRSPHIVDEKIRDSGVDSGDWPESTHMQTPETRSRDVERRLGPSPFNTPVLHEPSRHDATTPIADPEKKLRRSNKDYGGLATAAAGATMLAAGAAHRDDKGHGGNDRRAISDSHAATGSGSVLGSERAEAGVARRSVSNTSLSRQRTPEPLKLRPESPGSSSGFRSTATPTPPPLRRVDKRMSGDLRALRQQNNSTPPVANEARVRTKDMADVYDGYGEGRLGSPKSPTRPHSMRRRQSMQVLELESRVEQLVAENRLLTEARNHAEQTANRSATSALSERDAEIDALKQSLQYLQNEVNRLTEVNEGLTSANAELARDNNRYPGLSVYGDGTRGLEGPDGNPLQTLEEKDAEIASLREQLEAANEQVREMQRQILASKAGDSEFLNIRDEDYFDSRCQQLCSHVQQWVLRFSKFSDMRACRLTSEINDEKTIDRLDNAVLDGSDVDVYLNDRVKRRDIFMSMTMSMIWEFVFTRYLFGMDREQRQKLKSLEKLLTEVGPQNAVRQWRAVTLTLLAKRASFLEQRELDTEAVVQAIFQTLCKILPPPSNLENQIQSQLRRVMREAVDLSVTMRTQRAEYMMLPPLQPEYDADGELAATVQFNASMMNERSAQNKQSNEEIEADNSIVRVVLFPLVVKKGDDTGVGDDEIVVCPAQVLIARELGRRHVTPSSDAGGASLLGAPSRLSVTTDAMVSQQDV